jgi:uncharacterized protein
MQNLETLCTAFAGPTCIAHGRLQAVALAAKSAIDQAATAGQSPVVLVFEDASSAVIELDWRGSADEFAVHLTASAESAPYDGDMADTPDVRRGPGRPRLGVVAREVTLLPRHWEWLATQPGGASVALRKLVDVARRTSELKDRVRRASEVGYRFMSTMAGQPGLSLAGFEEASRALFAGDQTAFDALVADWPYDIQTHLKTLLADAFVPHEPAIAPVNSDVNPNLSPNVNAHANPL